MTVTDKVQRKGGGGVHPRPGVSSCQVCMEAETMAVRLANHAHHGQSGGNIENNGSVGRLDERHP